MGGRELELALWLSCWEAERSRGTMPPVDDSPGRRGAGPAWELNVMQQSPGSTERPTYGESVEALAEETTDLGELLAALPDERWRQPTRLPGWDVLTLVAHLVGALETLAQYTASPSTAPPEFDRASYYRYDAAQLAPGVDARARAAAQGQTPDRMRRALAAAAAGALATARALDPALVITSRRGTIRLDDFLATRVLEACVHGLDLRAAIGAPLTPTRLALRVTCALLERMLGGPRPPDLADDVACAEAGTGRRPHADARFPLLQ